MTEFDPARNRTATVGVEQLASMRGAFLQRVYGHLAAAVAVFTLIEVFLFKSGIVYPLTNALVGVNWLIVLGGFMVTGWLGRSFAYRAGSVGSQYLGLGLYIVAQAIIFAPLLAVANVYVPGAIQNAALITLLGFTLLTMLALSMRRDFTFLGGILRWAGIVALAAIIGSVVFHFSLGTWFSVGMVALAGAAVLYDTQRILVTFPDDRHVGAALELFASIALMFWYVLRLLIGSRR
ncbi:MAG TPA: Bax inhibitor-1 family protein [Candidatus Krumholzibacteria bacterium]|nr:Bax inhibitor-1 family protein [Candidatus Krumholzibacteria bacterium]HPD70706.1 Bax inhibitor-1 family protein [Candidatus Krumholzibacteria bacterium]HRY39594.1 Bax inhibitor-1 family protein [Candidatus Krumholzibacteria bacterium]